MKEESSSGYEYSWAPEPRNWGKECECGAEKTRGMESCSRCAFLDGSHAGQALIIDTLRVTGVDGMSINQICEEIHGKVTKGYYQGVSLILQALVRRKRVARRMEETEVEHTGRLSGSTKRVVYYLKEGA
jgi:hypothetical protein